MHSSSEYSRPVAWARCASNIMDNFIRRRMGSGPKPQRNDFFGVFTHYCTKPLAILLQCSDDTQTYRIVDHFILKGGKTKIGPQNSSQFLFTTSEISRVSRSWFPLREILLTFLFRNFIALLRLHSSSQYSRPVAWARCASNIMDNLIRKRMGSGPKATKNGFFGVSTHYYTKTLAILLQCSDDTQIFRILAHFTLKGCKTKIEPQNSSQFLFTTSENSRVSQSWLSFRETLAHFSVSYFYCIASIALKLTV